MFDVGMYGGCFNPLHLGHVNDIIKASCMCKELHIILSYSKTREKISYKQRFQWLSEVTKELENVVLHAIEDYDNDKDSYDWNKGAQNIRKAIGKDISVVFCGDDYKGTNRFESLYPESQIIYFERKIIDISSTQIRENPFKYWDYLPKPVQKYFTKKVLILGGESTGKSTLTRNLALAFNTNYLEEVGRTVCERAQSEEMMLPMDFYEILAKHKAKEYEKLENANRVLFIDTDCLTTLFYSNLLCDDASILEVYNNIAINMATFNKYDLVLFLEPEGTNFIQDGTRNDGIGAARKKYSDILKSFYDNLGIKYISIKGSYIERFETAYNEVKHLF